MKKIIFILLAACTSLSAAAQSATELNETASNFVRQGDYANAVLVYNRALQLEPKNIITGKNLAFAYYMQGQNEKALTIIKPVLEDEAADDQCFQIGGNIYKALQQYKECEKMYKKAIRKFPQSGPLYSDFGELLYVLQDKDAIVQWEAGIEQDPAYGKNYYNASQYYYNTEDNLWSALYGEIFVNMDPFGSNTAEIKNQLLELYKKIFTNPDLLKARKNPSDFEKTFLSGLQKQSSQAMYGINTSTLTMIRARFILDWFAGKGSKFPHQLFEMQQELLREGLFDAYNQWLFAPAENLSAYQNWINTHQALNKDFVALQKNRQFKMPANQYYQK